MFKDSVGAGRTFLWWCIVKATRNQCKREGGGKLGWRRGRGKGGEGAATEWKASAASKARFPRTRESLVCFASRLYILVVSNRSKIIRTNRRRKYIWKKKCFDQKMSFLVDFTKHFAWIWTLLAILHPNIIVSANFLPGKSLFSSYFGIIFPYESWKNTIDTSYPK